MNKTPPNDLRFAEDEPLVTTWSVTDVANWAENAELGSKQLVKCLKYEHIDGQVLLALTEDDVRDMRYRLGYQLAFGELKKFWLAVQKLQMRNKINNVDTTPGVANRNSFETNHLAACACPLDTSETELYYKTSERNIPPEYFKTAISMGYSFLVTWITSFVMVIVHERVPDMKRYPPLPDIFLDNVPHIPWAFKMCEITGTLLFTIWVAVITFHKHRSVLLRRFFALAGTVFLLRCVTMLITSLSVPGAHLECSQKDHYVDDNELNLIDSLAIRISRAYFIWSGLGMSLQGVRTCGDYMFSGHTVALTLMNFFITEYTPRHLYFLHTLTWLLNMFGIFFILAAHEHYSIDVFVAFYITSRLFLYYHTLANNQALMQRDSTRTRIWFPLFSYFESSMSGIIPNEYDSISSMASTLLLTLYNLKDIVMLTAHRYWLETPIGSKSSIHIFSAGRKTPSDNNNARTLTDAKPIVVQPKIIEYKQMQTPEPKSIDVQTSVSFSEPNSIDNLKPPELNPLRHRLIANGGISKQYEINQNHL